MQASYTTCGGLFLTGKSKCSKNCKNVKIKLSPTITNRVFSKKKDFNVGIGSFKEEVLKVSGCPAQTCFGVRRNVPIQVIVVLPSLNLSLSVNALISMCSEVIRLFNPENAWNLPFKFHSGYLFLKFIFDFIKQLVFNFGPFVFTH